MNLRLWHFLTLSAIAHALVVAGFWSEPKHSPVAHIEVSVAYQKGESAEKIETSNDPRLAGHNSQRPAAAVDSVSQEASSGSNTATILGDSVGLRATYPRLSRLLKETGEVLIRVSKREGDSPDVSLSVSSGFPRLDQAAISASQDGVQSGIMSEILQARAEIFVKFIFRLND